MKRMTLTEFCLVMAENMEQAESMPDLDFSEARFICLGLCSVARQARDNKLITEEQKQQFIHLLDALYQKSESGAYYWRPGLWQPRVRALRRMAEYFAKEGQ